MIIELIIALIFGVFVGTLTGLLPGIHINLVSAFLISVSVFFLTTFNLQPIILAVFIVSMAITHTFVDYIPSVYLGCPNDDTILSVLPGHELLKQGKGHEAVFLTAFGGLFSVAIVFLFSFIFIFFLENIYSYIKIIIPYLLILVSVFLISEENKSKKFLALVVFLLCGFLGISALNLNIKEPLLPLLTGLFGASSLIITIKQKTKIQKQNITKLEIPEKKETAKAMFASIIFSPLCSFLPALGSGQAATLGAGFFNLSKKAFLIMLGATNIIIMSLSFVTLYAISKARTGAAYAISRLISELTKTDLIIILIIIFLTSIIAFFLTIFISTKISAKIHKMDYSKLSFFILIFLIIIVFLFSGFLGLLVFITSTFTGIFCIFSGVRRINMISCLLTPTILFYLLV